MKYITIIPARGGSKRFPCKNVFSFLGKPLIAHSIEYSLKCNEIVHTFVSTDDINIKNVSIHYGAEIIERPSELGSDFATSADVMKNAVEQLILKGLDFDYVILLQPTNPLRPLRLIKEAIEIVKETNIDSLMTVNRCELKLGKIINNHYHPWNYHYGQRSQDLEPLYYENGLLYISSKKLLLQGKITSDEAYPMVVHHIFGTVDIDTREDLEYAEYVANRYAE